MGQSNLSSDYIVEGRRAKASIKFVQEARTSLIDIYLSTWALICLYIILVGRIQVDELDPSCDSSSLCGASQ